ncbi:MAG: enoyl-CoA hydratase-related protein [Saprospiraceae bacterium]
MRYIITKLEDSILQITLNRPEVYNGFNKGMSIEVQEALRLGSESENIRAIVITAQGKAFSSGQDLKEASESSELSMRRIILDQYNPIISEITKCPKPVIAGVNGIAAGAGANIALACDIIIAAQSASFIQAFSKIGLIPDSGGTFFLPRLVGYQRAKALMMTGDKITANEALQMGMVYKVFADSDFEEQLMTFARQMAEMPTKALYLTKQLLEISLNSSLENQLLNEVDYQEMAGETNDFKEGMKAFIEKRKPQFNGN